MITLHTAWLKLTKNVICLGAQDVATSSSSSSSSSGIRVGGSQDIQLDYTKMKLVAEEKGLSIVSVPVDGDCALHAIIRQLQQQGIHSYNVRMLRELATEHLESHSELVNFTMLSRRYGGDMKAYLRQQAVQGTLCDDAMIHAVAVLTQKIICVVDDSGSHTKFESQICCGKPITIGRIAGAHYVSLEARGASSHKDPSKPDESAVTSSDSAADDDRFKVGESDRDRKDHPDAVLRFSYSKLKSEAEKRSLSVVDIPGPTGESALHAVVRQLERQGIQLFDVTTLRKRAVDYLYSHKYLIDKNLSEAQSYLHDQSVPGTHCDERMLSAVSQVITKEIHVLRDDGHLKKLGKGVQTSHARPVVIGVYAKDHYVSLERSNSKQEYKIANDVDTKPVHDQGQLLDQVKSSEFQDEATIQRPSSSAADDATDKPVAAASNTCAICMDVIKDAKTLPCAHVFCSQCIDQSLAYQPKCPCCGKIFGVLKGDQPEGGSMRVRTDRWLDLEGYPKCGRIVIDYYVPDGRQKVLYNTLYLIVCMSCFV